MRNMVVLVDANVLLNYLLNRDNRYGAASEEVARKCAHGECLGYIAFHTLSIIWCLLRKLGDDIRRQCLIDICAIFEIAVASKSEIIAEIEKRSFADFEDCLQDKCAKEIGADYIVTCNIDDFAGSEVPALTPAELIGLLADAQTA